MMSHGLLERSVGDSVFRDDILQKNCMYQTYFELIAFGIQKSNMNLHTESYSMKSVLRVKRNCLKFVHSQPVAGSPLAKIVN